MSIDPIAHRPIETLESKHRDQKAAPAKPFVMPDVAAGNPAQRPDIQRAFDGQDNDGTAREEQAQQEREAKGLGEQPQALETTQPESVQPSVSSARQSQAQQPQPKAQAGETAQAKSETPQEPLTEQADPKLVKDDGKTTERAEKIADREAIAKLETARQNETLSEPQAAPQAGSVTQSQENGANGTIRATQQNTMPATMLQTPPAPAQPQVENADLRAQQVQHTSVRLASSATEQRRETSADNDNNRQQNQSQQDRPQQAPLLNQNSATTPSATAQANNLSATAQGQPAPSPIRTEVVNTILDHLDRMRRSGRSWMEVDLPVSETGGSMTMQLRVVGNSVQARVQGNDADLADELERGWADMTRKASQRGVQLAPLQVYQSSDSNT